MAHYTTKFSTTLSKDVIEASLKARRLYREALRQVPRIITNYNLSVDIPQGRARVTEEFRKHQGVKDATIIDRLVFKGATELDEAKEQWKVRAHVVSFFLPQRKEESDFMRRFFEGDNSDEEIDEAEGPLLPQNQPLIH
ncbi:NADH dehydrogenase 1 alpha subcomplex subunit 6 ndufa6 [Balamuthia mandrillaris]